MKPDEIKTVAVIGAGDMGHGIAEICAMSGRKVNLYDIKEEFVERGQKKIAASFEKMVAKGKMVGEDMTRALENISGFTKLSDAVKNIDYMIEAAPEILDLKTKIFKEACAHAPSHAILASNTSTMSISKMGAATKRPDKVLGVHFFNPVMLLKLVEVVRGGGTSDETMQTSCDFVSKLDNFSGTMVLVRVKKDTPGFIFSRIAVTLGLYLAEIYEKGLISPEAVDAKVRSIGAPMGPYETMDFIGLDVNLHSHAYFAETLSPEFEPRSWIKRLVGEGRMGKKSGRGIYDWPEGARPTIHLEKADPNFDLMDIICLQVNEGTKLLEDGVTDSPAEIDKAVVNGGGAAFGPFSIAKDMGWAQVAAQCEAISRRLGIQWFMPTETLKRGNIKI